MHKITLIAPQRLAAAISGVDSFSSSTRCSLRFVFQIEQSDGASTTTTALPPSTMSTSTANGRPMLTGVGRLHHRPRTTGIPHSDPYPPAPARYHHPSAHRLRKDGHYRRRLLESPFASTLSILYINLWANCHCILAFAFALFTSATLVVSTLPVVKSCAAANHCPLDRKSVV